MPRPLCPHGDRLWAMQSAVTCPQHLFFHSRENPTCSCQSLTDHGESQKGPQQRLSRPPLKSSFIQLVFQPGSLGSLPTDSWSAMQSIIVFLTKQSIIVVDKLQPPTILIRASLEIQLKKEASNKLFLWQDEHHSLYSNPPCIHLNQCIV